MGSLTRQSRAAVRRGGRLWGICITTARALGTRTSTRRCLRDQQVRGWTSEATWSLRRPVSSARRGAPPPRLRRCRQRRSGITSQLFAFAPTTMTGLNNPPSIKLPGLSIHASNNNGTAHQRRGRSGSFLKVEHVTSSNEEALDQAAYANINAEWVNRKGGSSQRPNRPVYENLAASARSFQAHG